ncbi:MAG: heme-binding protein [Ardenticatenaceae bacterium]
MTNTNTNKYRRLGGASTRRLSHHPGQRLIDQVDGTEAQLLTPEELTGELWSELEGTWVGNKGWNIIAMPAPGTTPDYFDSDRSSVLLVQPYMETLTFSNPGAPARNRGGDRDQFIPALEYHQRVSHLETGELLHVENGMFLNLSTIVGNRTKNILPPPEFNIARSGTIPHGNSIMILGEPPSVEPGAPDIPDISSFPFRRENGVVVNFPLNDKYLFDYQTHEYPPDVPNPNETLREELLRLEEEGGSIISTTTMTLDSENSGGITNIPFIVERANATRVSATFWLEKVSNSDGIEFLQLQYSQTILLEFHHFDQDGPILIWPHTTINTLVKQ